MSETRIYTEMLHILEGWEKQLSEIIRSQNRILEVQPGGHNKDLENAALILLEKLGEAKEKTRKDIEFRIT